MLTKLTAFILLYYVGTNGVSSPVAISGIATRQECERLARVVITDVKSEELGQYYMCIEYEVAR